MARARLDSRRRADFSAGVCKSARHCRLGIALPEVSQDRRPGREKVAPAPCGGLPACAERLRVKSLRALRDIGCGSERAACGALRTLWSALCFVLPLLHALTSPQRTCGRTPGVMLPNFFMGLTLYVRLIGDGGLAADGGGGRRLGGRGGGGGRGGVGRRRELLPDPHRHAARGAAVCMGIAHNAGAATVVGGASYVVPGCVYWMYEMASWCASTLCRRGRFAARSKHA